MPASVLFDSEAAAIAALNHARAMLIHAAEMRVKNFNFFLVTSGILLAAVVRGITPAGLVFISIIGFLLNFVFFILDVRSFALIKDARADLYHLEPKFGITIHGVDQLPDAHRKIAGTARNRIISHSFSYRAMYFIMALLWGTLLGLGLSGRTPIS